MHVYFAQTYQVETAVVRVLWVTKDLVLSFLHTTFIPEEPHEVPETLNRVLFTSGGFDHARRIDAGGFRLWQLRQNTSVSLSHREGLAIANSVSWDKQETTNITAVHGRVS